MREKFESGGNKVKSFVKAAVVKKECKSEPRDQQLTYSNIQIEYEDEYEVENNVKSENASKLEPTHIIIEPIEEQYDDDYDEEETETEEQYHQSHEEKQASPIRRSADENVRNCEPAHKEHPIQKENLSKTSLLSSSNELFLRSLLQTFDKLSEEKNMRARIKIQEILYQLVYEK